MTVLKYWKATSKMSKFNIRLQNLMKNIKFYFKFEFLDSGSPICIFLTLYLLLKASVILMTL